MTTNNRCETVGGFPTVSFATKPLEHTLLCSETIPRVKCVAVAENKHFVKKTLTETTGTQKKTAESSMSMAVSILFS
jgi:hypothetical protein